MPSSRAAFSPRILARSVPASNQTKGSWNERASTVSPGTSSVRFHGARYIALAIAATNTISVDSKTLPGLS